MQTKKCLAFLVITDNLAEQRKSCMQRQMSLINKCQLQQPQSAILRNLIFSFVCGTCDVCAWYIWAWRAKEDTRCLPLEPSTLFFNCIYLCVCVCAHVCHVHTCQGICVMIKEQLAGTGFIHVGCRDWTQVVDLGGLYLLKHLMGLLP